MRKWGNGMKCMNRRDDPYPNGEAEARHGVKDRSTASLYETPETSITADVH